MKKKQEILPMCDESYQKKYNSHFTYIVTKIILFKI